MKPFPTWDENSDMLLVRTDFSDDAVWRSVLSRMQGPTPEDEDEFTAEYLIVDDPAYAGLTKEQIYELTDPERGEIFVVDKTTITDPEHPVWIVSVSDENERIDFRCLPEEAIGIENNLSMANMELEEFHEAADSDGVFRGFKD
ncbi:DUF6924 domain-containing protein [Saccharopolyspora elongata]|uniref:DUF6924 domain-containing protein n=1 Tax=Saccharopolyspora elongata TaxID=2530387 RepID=A0A4V2YNP7_9PSEU|nr:hypothetical protein [Saccharopolyspora elongata]TDD55147.1 hypothetical protein E1288_04835 [Saccharopolyspora elongata]